MAFRWLPALIVTDLINTQSIKIKAFFKVFFQHLFKQSFLVSVVCSDELPSIEIVGTMELAKNVKSLPLVLRKKN